MTFYKSSEDLRSDFEGIYLLCKYTNLKDTAGQSARGNGNNPLEVVFDGVPNVHIISNEGMIKGKRFHMMIVEIS